MSPSPKPTPAMPLSIGVALPAMAQTGQAHDHPFYLLEGSGVAHVPDIINTDQPLFCGFAGTEDTIGYHSMIETIGSLDRSYLLSAMEMVAAKNSTTKFLDDLEAGVARLLAKCL